MTRIVVRVALLAIAMLLPTAAQASAGTFTCFIPKATLVAGECKAPASQFPAFYGKASLEFPVEQLTAGGAVGVRVLPVTGWRWNAGAWSRVDIDNRTVCAPFAMLGAGNCWHHGFGGGWSWYWEQRFGWLAVRTASVTLHIPTAWVAQATRTSCTAATDPNAGRNTLIGWTPGWTCSYSR